MRVTHSASKPTTIFAGAAFFLAFAGIIGLSLGDGGYDAVVRNQIGILVWWLLGLGAVFGLLPRVRPPRLAIVGGAALLGLVGWMALGLFWTESAEGTMADVGRVSVIAGFFLAAMALRPPKGVPRVIDGVAAAVAVVCLLALLSRLFPGLFPGSGDTALLVTASEGRLSFPVDYWNGLAALAAVGIAPVLALATEPGSRLVRSLAAGFLPVVALTVFLTYSRTGIIACLLALVVFVCLATRAVQRGATLGLVAVGSAALIGIVAPRPEIADGVVNAGLSGVADTAVLVAVPLIALATGVAQWFLTGADDRLGRITWRPEKRSLAIGGLVAAVVLVGLFFAASGPTRVSDAWHEFESPGEVQAAGANRLTSFGGNNRVQYWRSALHQFDSEPLHGRGSGTFELWSNRSEDTEGFVRDAHSWYLETLGELGAVGGLLLLSILLIVLAGGAAVVIRASSEVRPRLAAALAGSAAFFATAALDWSWELAVVPVAAFLLAGTLLMYGRRDGEAEPSPAPLRVSTGVIAVLAIVAIWLPFTTAYLLDRSKDDAGRGDLAGAYAAASAAADVPPKSMGPVLQQALLLDENGETDAALAKATEATGLEPTNWRPWFVRSYLEARLRMDQESRASFAEARSLNPHSSLLVNGYPSGQ